MNVLIVGVNGQDGQLLARHLARLGHSVTGIGRQRQAAPLKMDCLVQYHATTVGRNAREYSQLLNDLKPSAVFYLAAVHGPSGTQLENDWEALQSTSILGLHHTLEYARQAGGVQVVNFSSSRVFGRNLNYLVTEDTARQPDDLYGVVKNNADALVEFYSRIHNVRATSLLLFNHESNLRGPEFFSRKLIQQIWSLSKGACLQNRFATFDFWRDWGLADEYMEVVANSFQLFKQPRYILATGQTVYTRQMVADICEEIGVDKSAILELSWDASPAGAAEGPPPWTASPTALLQDTGFAPQIYGKEVFLHLLRELRDDN